MKLDQAIIHLETGIDNIEAEYIEGELKQEIEKISWDLIQKVYSNK